MVDGEAGRAQYAVKERLKERLANLSSTNV